MQQQGEGSSPPLLLLSPPSALLSPLDPPSSGDETKGPVRKTTKAPSEPVPKSTMRAALEKARRALEADRQKGPLGRSEPTSVSLCTATDSLDSASEAAKAPYQVHQQQRFCPVETHQHLYQQQREHHHRLQQQHLPYHLMMQQQQHLQQQIPHPSRSFPITCPPALPTRFLAAGCFHLSRRCAPSPE